MKKLIIILAILLIFPKNINALEDLNDRSKFNYEVLDVSVSNGVLSLRGWGFVNENQNLHNSNTHSYTIELHSNGKITRYPTSLVAYSLTDIMSYNGYRKCTDGDRFVANCNYTYNNVGFQASIDTKHLESDQSYSVYLVIHTKQTNKEYRAPLYYAQSQPIVEEHDQRTMSITSTFKQMSFSVYYHTLRTTPKPQPFSSSNMIRLANYCTSSYENIAFYKQGTQFNTILGVSYYQGIIPYYQVRVEDAGCYDSRRRVQEGNGNDIIAHVPATYISYNGKAMIIDILQHSIPILSTENHTVEQYAPYNPLNHATAWDKEEGDISTRIKVTKNTVNTKIPSTYETCYAVTNKRNITTKKCVNVEVTKIPVRLRYINSKSVNHAVLSIWQKLDLVRILNE